MRGFEQVGRREVGGGKWERHRGKKRDEISVNKAPTRKEESDKAPRARAGLTTAPVQEIVLCPHWTKLSALTLISLTGAPAKTLGLVICLSARSAPGDTGEAEAETERRKGMVRSREVYMVWVVWPGRKWGSLGLVWSSLMVL